MTTARIKSLEGVMIPLASISISQLRPVKPLGHTHWYLRGGCRSWHQPPFWQGSQSHSFTFTHSMPRFW